MKFLIEHHQNTIRIGYKEITILQSWNTRLDADSAIRSSGYSLSGARGTWIRFVLVQIGTRRLGTRSGLACQLARVPRIRDALGFSHRIPGTSAPAYTRREWARARLMNYCADLERLRSFLPVRSRARDEISSTKHSGNSTLGSSFHKGDFVRANCPGQLLCEAEFRQEIPGGNFSRSFQPCNILSSKESCLLLGRWFLLENYMRGKTRENLKGEFLGGWNKRRWRIKKIVIDESVVGRSFENWKGGREW